METVDSRTQGVGRETGRLGGGLVISVSHMERTHGGDNVMQSAGHKVWQDMNGLEDNGLPGAEVMATEEDTTP